MIYFSQIILSQFMYSQYYAIIFSRLLFPNE